MLRKQPGVEDTCTCVADGRTWDGEGRDTIECVEEGRDTTECIEEGRACLEATHTCVDDGRDASEYVFGPMKALKPKVKAMKKAFTP